MPGRKDIKRCLIPADDLHYGENIELQDTSTEFYRFLLESIKRDGIKEPILVINLPDKLHVKAGNSRLWAARKTGIEKIDCVVVTLERDSKTVRPVKGKDVENIYDEFEFPIHWVEKENYVSLKCTHIHLGHEEVV